MSLLNTRSGTTSRASAEVERDVRKYTPPFAEAGETS